MSMHMGRNGIPSKPGQTPAKLNAYKNSDKFQRLIISTVMYR